MRRTLALIAISGLLIGCPGGDDNGTVGTTAPATTVSGSVKAPNGQIALSSPPGVIERLANLLTQPVYASLSGLSPVPDGTPVQLARFNATGTSVSVLSTTTTSGGRFSFNLTNLGVQFSNDLIVLVTGPTGKMIRSFVTNQTADLDPSSELAVRLVLEHIASTPGTTFSNFTLREVNDLSASVKLLASVKQLAGGADLENTVGYVRTAVLADAPLMAFITTAAAPGQTTEGPGDIGNFFPFAQGNIWNFQGTKTENGQASTFQNTLTIVGTSLVGGMNVTVFSETHPGGDATAEDVYLRKESVGITNHGNNDSTDLVTPQVIPYQELQFPLQAGATFQQLNKSGLNFGQDVDGDGKTEAANLTSSVSVGDFQTISVPAGSFSNTLPITTELLATVFPSKGGAPVQATGIQTIWLAPGIGPIKRLNVTKVQGVTTTTTEELVSHVVNGQGAGTVPLTIATGVTQADSNTTNPGPSGIASDGTNYLAVYCQDLGASPGLYGRFITGGDVSQPFFIAPRTCSFNNGIGVAFDGTTYLVVFSNNGTIWGVRVSKTGSVLDGAGGFAISTGAPSITNFGPTIAFDGTNYLVAWQKFIGAYDIYGARVTSNGQVLAEFPIFTATGEQVFPSLAFDGTNYLVVWRDTRSGSGPSTDTHIYGTRVSTAGTVLDAAGIAIATAGGYQGEPSIAFDGTNYFVVWSDIQQLGIPASQIYGKRLNTNGTLLDGPADSLGIPINTTAFHKSAPTVAFDGTNYLVAYAVNIFPTNAPPTGIYGAKVSMGGQLVSGTPDALGILLAGPTQNSGDTFAYPVAHSNQSSTLLTCIVNRIVEGTTKSILGLLIFP